MSRGQAHSGGIVRYTVPLAEAEDVALPPHRRALRVPAVQAVRRNPIPPGAAELPGRPVALRRAETERMETAHMEDRVEAAVYPLAVA